MMNIKDLKIGYFTGDLKDPVGNIRIYNLTPHDLNVVTEDGSVLTVQKSGLIARVSQINKPDGAIGFINITKRTFGEVEDLPEPVDSVFYIVSSLVASAAKGRDDLFVPGPLVRNKEGNVIGCKGLSRV